MISDKPQGIRIILVRHGETEWNRLHRFQGRTDIPLNSKGVAQARAAGLALQHEQITAIVSSPLQRAFDTALQIATFHKVPTVIKNAGFIEMDLGEFEGMEAKKWVKEHSEFRLRWEASPGGLSMPGGESLKKVQERVVDTLESICASLSSGSTLVICTHNFVIGSLLCFASKISLDDFRQLKQDTAAINIIYKSGSEFTVETVNDCGHLQELM
ncbi:histidine phosphatase family protein [Desulforhopalus sp. 52FAK]